MTSQTRPGFSFSRLSVVGAFALFGLATAGAAASPPFVDNGGPGGSSAVAAEQTPVLVGSGPERETVARSDALDGPVLVGSGPEREIVATSQETASGEVDWPVLAGSGYEGETADATQQVEGAVLNESNRSAALIDLTSGGEAASGTLDEAARSVDLIALSPVPGTFETAVIQHGQPY